MARLLVVSVPLGVFHLKEQPIAPNAVQDIIQQMQGVLPVHHVAWDPIPQALEAHHAACAAPGVMHLLLGALFVQIAAQDRIPQVPVVLAAPYALLELLNHPEDKHHAVLLVCQEVTQIKEPLSAHNALQAHMQQILEALAAYNVCQAAGQVKAVRIVLSAALVRSQATLGVQPVTYVLQGWQNPMMVRHHAVLLVKQDISQQQEHHNAPNAMLESFL